MTVKERFENLVNKIDTQIKIAGPEGDPVEICENALASAGEENLVEAAAAFRYLTGSAIIPYIISIQAAVRQNIETAAVTWETVGSRELSAGETGKPLDIGAFGQNGGSGNSEFEAMLADAGIDLDLDLPMFDQPPAPYDPEEDIALRMAWGFNDIQTETAANAREKRNLSLRDSYKFAANLTDQFREYISGYEVTVDDMLYTSNAFDLTIDETVYLVKDLLAAGVEDIQQLPQDLIAGVLSSNIPYQAAANIYEVYKENNIRASFSEFLDRAASLGGVDKAVESFNDPEEEAMMKGFFDMMNIGFEDLNFFDSSEAELLRMEREAQADGFHYDYSAGDDFTDS